jgi:dTDP-4-amino-4,6-dideoxygalactose transaminase
MERILEITQSYHLRVLEDATEALGSFWGSGALKGKHAGTVGDIGVYSFNANKIITTGGGGMLVARREEDLRQAQYLTTTAKDDGLYFIHDEVGYNYRMLNLQAALGVSQIDKLDGFIETKKRNYELYAELLKDAPGMRLLPFKDEIRANYWFYSLLIDDEADGGYPACSRRDRVMKALISEGIQCRPVWRLCHAQKAYTECRVFDTELAHFYEKHILNIPCSTSLTEEDVRYVCGRILSLA